MKKSIHQVKSKIHQVWEKRVDFPSNFTLENLK